MRAIVKGSLGFKQLRSAALDSGGHEEALGAGKLKGRFGFGQAQRSALDAGNREGSLWVRANTRDALGAYKLEWVFWIRADVKERFGHGQTLKDVCEGALWKRKTLKAPMRSNTEIYAWYSC